MALSSRQRVLLSAALAVVVVTGVLVWFFAFRVVRPDALSRAALDAGLDAVVATCSEPWARPSLSGTSKTGNAATDQMAVVASMKGELPNPQDVKAWNAALEGNAKPYASLIARFGAELDALLETAERDHAWANLPIADGVTELPPLGRHRMAFKLLMLRSLRESTGACMHTIPIVVRLGQDVAAGNAIFGAVMLNRIFDDASEVLNACSRIALEAERKQARDDLVVLLGHPIPFGRAVQCELGLQMASLRTLLDAGASTDTDEELTLWTMLLGASERVAPTTAQDFPAAFDLFAGELSRLERARLGASVIINNRKLFGDYVAAYAGAQARLRAMIVALEGQISGVRDEPPAATLRAELADPFSGKPLIWRHLKRCSVVWSVGPNRTNDSLVFGDEFQRNEDDEYVWACFEPR